MPGFMGIGKLKTQTTHDIEKERREEEEPRRNSLPEMERRAWEKVQDILQDQEAPPDPPTAARNPAAAPGAEGASPDDPPKVSDVLAGRVVTVTFDDTVLMVKGIFESVRFHHLPVVDEGGRLIGIISDRDFLKSVSPFLGTVNEQSRDLTLLKKKVGVIMTRNPVVIHPEDWIADAASLMSQKKVSCLPVVPKNDTLLLGIITWKDVVRAFCPEAFTNMARLKTGVNIRPKTAESARLSTVESARIFPKRDDAAT